MAGGCGFDPGSQGRQMMSLMLTFNFSVGRFVSFCEFWPEWLHRVEAFAICGYAFPGFPHFTFELV